MDAKSLVSQILDIELEMFKSVPARYPVPCQDDEEGFRIMRAAQFAVWSEDTLRSYLHDLEAARQADRNLMTLKYARMEDLVAPLQTNVEITELIEEIVLIQLQWQREMEARYPALMARARPLTDDGNGTGETSFQRYLQAELETYSPVTLTNLFRDIVARQVKGQNMTEEIYEHMVKALGYSSLVEADENARRQTTQ
jgi:hypothetical protein